MKEKRLHILLPIIILCASVLTNAQVKFGIKAGGNYTNIKYVDDNGSSIYTYPKTGYQFGVFADIPISRSVFFQPSLMYSVKGYNEDRKVYLPGNTLYITATFRPSPIYIEMPLNLFYIHQFNKLALFAGGGPYVSYGLGGKYRFIPPKDFEDVVITSGKLQFLEDYWNVKNDTTFPYQRHIDLGANAQVGVGFMKHFSFTIGAQYGLLNLYPYAQGTRPIKASITSYGGYASIGYRF